MCEESEFNCRWCSRRVVEQSIYLEIQRAFYLWGNWKTICISGVILHILPLMLSFLVIRSENLLCNTKSGTVSICVLPWLTHHTFLRWAMERIALEQVLIASLHQSINHPAVKSHFESIGSWVWCRWTFVSTSPVSQPSNLHVFSCA